jgi:4-amino-4-deoxy-L-arabinose transferase-like glycosyltransferase
VASPTRTIACTGARYKSDEEFPGRFAREFFIIWLDMPKLFRTSGFQISLVLLAAAAWKLLFFFWDVIPFNADEAIVALMARHIGQGARPVFFYGQAYMGSLDAFLVALGFQLFGQQVWVIRLVQMLLYLGTIITTYWIGRVGFRSPTAGLLAAALLAVPTVNMTLYTTASLGGYGEALLLGNLVLLVALLITGRVDSGRSPRLLFLLWGILAGVGLWANGLTLIYTAPAGLYLLWRLGRSPRRWQSAGAFLLVGGAGFLLGSLPWWIYAITNGPNRLILELFGTAVAVEKESWLLRTGLHLINFLLLGTTALFGARPPWSVTWLALPLLPLALAFWLAVIVFFVRKAACPGEHRPVYILLSGVCAVLLAGFLFTPFGADPSGRYFLPLCIPLALTAAQMLLSARLVDHRLPRALQNRGTWLAGCLAGLVILFNLWGTLQCALKFPPGITTQFYDVTIIDHRHDADLMAFLRSQGETRGYTNYWVAYPLAFLSREELIFVPRLPYHLDLRYTPRDDRYTAYTEMVVNSPRVAYIATGSPLLKETLREQFAGLGVTWQERQIGDYLVFYALSRPVRPQEIGFGELRQ